MKYVLECIYMAHLMVMIILNFMNDLIFLRHAIKAIKVMTPFVHFKDL